MRETNLGKKVKDLFRMMRVAEVIFKERGEVMKE